LAGISSLTALEGVWTLTRRIAHSDGSTHHFDGIARFTRSGKRLIHFEEGLLTGVPGQAPMRGTRRYVWSMEPGRIEVMFDDMRPFHTIPVATPRPETTYLCPPDRYEVAYDFSDMKSWRAVWTVEGPKKAYVMESLFRTSER
jgi:hypothetical protein